MIYYIRDEEGSLIGIKYNNEIYYYIKNLQEDIIGITDSNYNLLCRYEYDSWGRIITIKDNNGNIIEEASHIGIINPYRYRSYYYDKETKLYYLNSRYYNPEWGRFINADSYLGVSGDILGYNLYVYVSNNPINNTDESGRFLKKAWNWVKKKAKQAAKTVKKAASNVYKGAKKIVETVKKSFIFEAEVGFGAGASVQVGEAKAGAELSKTFGYSYSDNNSSQYTSTAAGASVGYKEKSVGLSIDIRNYDNGNGNPMTMPWEIWDDVNTTCDLTVVTNHSEYVGSEVNDKGGHFIGVSFGGFLVVGGKIKIGFNIGG